MNYSSDISPVGWYIATYQVRFVELADKRKNDPKRRFTTWENTVLVRAKTLDNAYRKVVEIGNAHTEPYKGGPDAKTAVDVQWLFEGIIELLPVYEEIEDGAEIMWGERTRTLGKILKLAKKASDFHQDKQRPKGRVV